MVFLSHSWADKKVARQVVEALAAEGIPSWLDEQQLTEGAELRASLRKAIASSDIYLYLASETANESTWIQDELNFALGLEHEGKIKVIPIRLADNSDELPTLLSGRFYYNLGKEGGSAAQLAHKLKTETRVDTVPPNCRLSTTVRIDEYQVVHTLNQTRKFGEGHKVHALLINQNYEAVDELYWSVSEVGFPAMGGTSREIEEAINSVNLIHEQSRSIIKESRKVCNRFISTKLGSEYQSYFDSGYERVIRVLLHRLNWNYSYLKKLKESDEITQSFLKRRSLPGPFDGHSCDFVSDERYVGSIEVPSHGHPLPSNMPLVSWRMTSPFADMFQHEVGIAIGEILALRFMAKTLSDIEMPSPKGLKYGLA